MNFYFRREILMKNEYAHSQLTTFQSLNIFRCVFFSYSYSMYDREASVPNRDLRERNSSDFHESIHLWVLLQSAQSWKFNQQRPLGYVYAQSWKGDYISEGKSVISKSIQWDTYKIVEKQSSFVLFLFPSSSTTPCHTFLTS